MKKNIAKRSPRLTAVLLGFYYGMGYKRMMSMTGISKRRLKNMKRDNIILQNKALGIRVLKELLTSW